MGKWAIVLLTGWLLAGCAATEMRFADTDPVWDLNDRKPIPLPPTSRYIRADYYFKVLVRRPTLNLLKFAPVEPARDVNSLDHVPASSWYTPRLGYRDISPEALLNGPVRMGPPRLPVRVVRAKHLGSNPGFVIADSRDQLYLIKFDPRDFPGVETATALIVNRLFWGFGYNVPEDYVFFFNSNEVPIDTTADITEEQVKLVFSTVAPPQNGLYRATASLLVDGLYLGPVDDHGTRKGDTNDRFPHEKRRILRALKVFGAFTNQTDIRIDNSLDVYVGTPPHGYVKHYLLDFGGAMGAHGAEQGRLWDGFRHVFSFDEMMGNMATLGLRPEPWEDITYPPWKSVGTLEAEYFDPLNWKEAYPFEPIRRAQPDDCYWATKIVAALNRAHIEALVEAAQYPEAGAAEYVVETLMKRREKVIRTYFGLVSPLEYVLLRNDTLVLADFGRKYLPDLPVTHYEVHFWGDGQKEIAPYQWLHGAGDTFPVLLEGELFRKGEGYVRIDVRVWRAGQPAPRPVEFHFRRQPDGQPGLVGVVH